MVDFKKQNEIYKILYYSSFTLIAPAVLHKKRMRHINLNFELLKKTRIVFFTTLNEWLKILTSFYDDYKSYIDESVYENFLSQTSWANFNKKNLINQNEILYTYSKKILLYTKKMPHVVQIQLRDYFDNIFRQIEFIKVDYVLKYNELKTYCKRWPLKLMWKYLGIKNYAI